MAGSPLTREQEIALFAKKHSGINTLNAKQRQELLDSQKEVHVKGGFGSVPQVSTHEKIALLRDFKNIKQNAQALESAKDAQKTKNDLEKARKKQAMDFLESQIKAQYKLRSDLASKRITYDEYQEALKKLQVKIPEERKVLPNLGGLTEKERRELADAEEEKERANIEKAKVEQENYYQDIKNPISIMPSGTQSGVKRYNPETGKYFISHSLTAKEQRDLGVDKPVGEGVLSGYDTIKVDVPLDKKLPDYPIEKPTMKSEKAKQQAEEEAKQQRASVLANSETGEVADQLQAVFS